jgi:hypothetical protein
LRETELPPKGTMNRDPGQHGVAVDLDGKSRCLTSATAFNDGSLQRIDEVLAFAPCGTHNPASNSAARLPTFSRSSDRISRNACVSFSEDSFNPPKTIVSCAGICRRRLCPIRDREKNYVKKDNSHSSRQTDQIHDLPCLPAGGKNANVPLALDESKRLSRCPELKGLARQGVRKMCDYFRLAPGT